MERERSPSPGRQSSVNQSGPTPVQDDYQYYQEDYEEPDFNPSDSRQSPVPNRSLEEAKSRDQSTFLTQKEEKTRQIQQPYTLNDLLFPGGKIAKLCKIPNPRSKDLKIGEILIRSGISDPEPVILLSGAEGDIRSRLLVGIARAAYSTDAIIVDNGLKSGIELACVRKKVKLIGVCPEELIEYPTRASTGERLGELAPGHSHYFIIGKEGDKMRWDSVVPFKIDLVERIRRGRGNSYTCRAVCVLVGDTNRDFWEVEKCLKNDWPVIIIENSPFGREISSYVNGGEAELPEPLKQALESGRVFLFPEEGTAEHLASAIHLHLSISI